MKFIYLDPTKPKMPQWSPYSYAFNNPLRYIDPDGRMPLDTYGVNSKGNITKIDDKKYYDKNGNEVDMLVQGTKVRYNKNGDIKNNHTYVKSGVLKQGLIKRSFEAEGKTYNYTNMNTGSDESTGLNLFEFLGNNTDVEWSIIQTEPFEGITSHSIFSSHIYDKEFAAASLLLSKDNPDLIRHLNYHYHSHPPTYKMGDTSRLSPSDADRDFAKRIRTAGSSATLKIFFNGQYSSGY